MRELAVIIPVYNEEAVIEKVAEDWITELDNLNADYNLIFYDGHSKDNTINLLENLKKNNDKIIIKKWEHIGHGPTIIQAYKETSKEYEWIFQADSDNEIPAKEFSKFWQERKAFDLVIGIRQNRKQELSRKITTNTSKILLKLLFGKTPFDTNCPFRLMKSNVFEKFFENLPDNLLVPNIFVSAFSGFHKINFKEIPVEYKFRETGVVSFNKITLFKIAIKSFLQIIYMNGKIKKDYE